MYPTMYETISPGFDSRQCSNCLATFAHFPLTNDEGDEFCSLDCRADYDSYGSSLLGREV